MVYLNDEHAMQQKPENARRDSVRTEVGAYLRKLDKGHEVVSFFGWAWRVGDYYVVPVIQIPEDVFTSYPVLDEFVVSGRYRSSPGLIHTAMYEVLSQAYEALKLPDAGRDGSIGADNRETIRAAANTFMKTPAMAIYPKEFFMINLFKSINDLAALLYEGTKGVGRLLLASPDNPEIKYSIRLNPPVSLREARWARKILQMSASDLAIISDGNAIHGLGTLGHQHDPARQDVFWVDFADHYFWTLRIGERALLRSHFGEVTLPQEPILQPRFIDSFVRIFECKTTEYAENMWALLECMSTQRHGSMIVVAADAAAEAQRLSKQGMVVEPFKLTPELLVRLSKIDGTILVDPSGLCHGVGLILDGLANDACTPSRGSRYNSAIRYVSATTPQRMALVQSDDDTTDVIPMILPRVSRTAIEKALVEFENGTLDNYHRPRNFLNEHRFYLSPEQCERANKAIERYDAIPIELYELRIGTSKFKPHADMNDSYLF